MKQITIWTAGTDTFSSMTGTLREPGNWTNQGASQVNQDLAANESRTFADLKIFTFREISFSVS